VSFVTDKQPSGSAQDENEYGDSCDDDELNALGDEMVAKEDNIKQKLSTSGEKTPKLMMKIASSLKSVDKITDYEQRLTKAQERI
jgi:hypothetical protein